MYHFSCERERRNRKGHPEHTQLVESGIKGSMAIGDITSIVRIKEEENGGYGYWWGQTKWVLGTPRAVWGYVSRVAGISTIIDRDREKIFSKYSYGFSNFF